MNFRRRRMVMEKKAEDKSELLSNGNSLKVILGLKTLQPIFTIK